VADGIWIGLALMVLVGIPGISIQAGRTTILQTHVEDAYRGRVFGALGTNTALLAFVGTLLASFAGGSLGPLLLLNVQGGVYVVSGLLVLAALAPGRLRPARDTA
jgi:hypothetical protein